MTKKRLQLPDGTPASDRWRLQADELAFPLDPATLGFRTTAELEPLDTVVGQERALRALEFGLALRHRGYNVFISGMTGPGRKQLVQRLLEPRALREPTPDDWVYVHNFDEPDCPLAVRLGSGQGLRLRAALEELLERLRQDLPAALKAKDFDAERERLGTAYGKRSEAFFNQLVERAHELGMAIRQMPNGVFLFVPLKDGKPMAPEDMERLSDEERADLERRQEELGDLTSEVLAKQQELSHALREEIHEIVRGFARRIVTPLIDRLKSDFPEEQVVRHARLDRIQIKPGQQVEEFLPRRWGQLPILIDLEAMPDLLQERRQLDAQFRLQ